MYTQTRLVLGIHSLAHWIQRVIGCKVVFFCGL